MLTGKHEKDTVEICIVCLYHWPETNMVYLIMNILIGTDIY